MLLCSAALAGCTDPLVGGTTDADGDGFVDDEEGVGSEWMAKLDPSAKELVIKPWWVSDNPPTTDHWQWVQNNWWHPLDRRVPDHLGAKVHVLDQSTTQGHTWDGFPSPVLNVYLTGRTPHSSIGYAHLCKPTLVLGLDSIDSYMSDAQRELFHRNFQDPASYRYSLEIVVIHEFGHTLCLEHTLARGTAMRSPIDEHNVYDLSAAEWMSAKAAFDRRAIG